MTLDDRRATPDPTVTCGRKNDDAVECTLPLAHAGRCEPPSRLDLLEAVATAATALRDSRRRCAETLAAWDAADTNDEIRQAVADDNDALHARILADEALDAAVALLEAHR